MKRFLRGLGIALMAYGAIGFVAILFNIVPMLRDMTGSWLKNFFVTVFVLALFAGLFFAGMKLRGANAAKPAGKEAAAPQPAGPAKASPVPERKEIREQPAPVPAASAAESGEAARLREEKRRKDEALREEMRRQAEQRRREEEDMRVGELGRQLRLPEGLALSRNPFEGILGRIGPDGLTDRSGVKMWLRAEAGADALETLRALTGWIGRFEAPDGGWKSELKSRFADVWWTVFSPLGYIYVVLTEDERALDGAEEAARALCEDRRIWYAVRRGGGLKDLVTGREYALDYQEWPGSADDAATYGEWDLSEIKDEQAAEKP